MQSKFSSVSSERTLVDHSRVNSIIERLQSISEGDDVPPSFPKIVVIGDQSSGKSSVLEGLTGLAFPVSRMLCTRFATEIIIRHSPNDFPTAKAYFVPENTLPKDVKARQVLLNSATFVAREAFDRQDFPRILNDAVKEISMLQPGSGLHKRSSKDVLKIEICGPDYEDLCIVDLPGLCYNPTIFQTEDDLEVIRRLSSEYIKDPQNIILTVIDATNNMSSQQGLAMAKLADPEGTRTVGVITKCDVVQLGEEQKVILLAQNEIEHLPCGWFTVKNRSKRDIRKNVTHEQRNINEEEFFNTCPWDELDKQYVGINSLKMFVNNHPVFRIRSPSNDIGGLMQEVRHLAEDAERSIKQFNVEQWNEKGAWRKANYTLDTIDDLESFDEKAGSRGGPKSISESSNADLEIDLEGGAEKARPIILLNAFMVAFTLALTLTLMGLGARQLAQEVLIDGSYARLALIIVTPLQIFITLFFAQALVGNICQMLGPVSQMQINSKFYSAVPPRRLDRKKGPLPHVTIQCPVYKEGLETVIRPTVESLEAAIATYEKQGGTATIFYNDDGMQLLTPEEAKIRQQFYVDHKIGWVARPKHNERADQRSDLFVRKGKFKKASNMNYALMISTNLEEKLLKVQRNEDWDDVRENKAYTIALEEVLKEEEGRAWAAGNIRIGDYILLIDSDTRVPEDCFIDAVSEMEQCPRVGIIQFSSGVMNVTTSYFENGITFFTNLIYSAIRYAVAAGDVSPFVGHNAILRWSALQETSFYDDDNTYEKFWSESHVSEDFDMALRLQTTGYIVRLAAYTGDGFKEGVSLTVYDELARWEKYAYGCNELLLHPMKDWLWKGPFTPLFLKFVKSNMPIGSKFTIMAYIGTYYAIGFAWISTLANYFLTGWFNGYLDHFYVDSFQVYFAIIIVFSAMGNVSLGVLRYRVEGRSLIGSLLENFKWIVLLCIFLGGISLHVSQALCSHLFSIEMSWGATSKESEDTTFFVELPRIFKRFKYTLLFCLSCTVLMICGAFVFPPFWRIDFFTAIWPLVTVVASHFFLPVLLNPALMMFTW